MSVIAGKGVQSKGLAVPVPFSFAGESTFSVADGGAWATAGDWVLPSPQEQGFGGGGSLKEIN